jgi:hypothetical protein
MTDVDVLPFDTSWLFEPTTGVHQFGGGSECAERFDVSAHENVAQKPCGVTASRFWIVPSGISSGASSHLSTHGKAQDSRQCFPSALTRRARSRGRSSANQSRRKAGPSLCFGLMIWSSRARNRSFDLVVLCFFCRIAPYDAPQNRGSQRRAIDERARFRPLNHQILAI